MKKTKSTHLYILSCGGKLKIGVTNDIQQRMKTLKTGNPEPLVLEFLEERTNPHKAEQYILNVLSKNRIKGTEWFVNTDVHTIRCHLMMFHDQEP
jgi:hypothetical protein